MKDEKLPVNSTDELEVEGGRSADRVRILGEYSETNMPLSSYEIELRKHLAGRQHYGWDWIPRNAETIRDLTPVPEEEPTHAE